MARNKKVETEEQVIPVPPPTLWPQMPRERYRDRTPEEWTKWYEDYYTDLLDKVNNCPLQEWAYNSYWTLRSAIVAKGFDLLRDENGKTIVKKKSVKPKGK